MQAYVATKLVEFEQGKISRRRLIEMLTVAATTAYATGGANAQAADPKLKVALVNHLSYTCPNFKQAGDWYSKVFGLDQVNVKANELAVAVRQEGRAAVQRHGEGRAADVHYLPHARQA